MGDSLKVLPREPVAETMNGNVIRVLDEMRTLVDMSAAPTLATVNHWMDLLGSAADDDPVIRSAREQARRDS